jgi:hypothetical protein
MANISPGLADRLMEYALNAEGWSEESWATWAFGERGVFVADMTAAAALVSAAVEIIDGSPEE